MANDFFAFGELLWDCLPSGRHAGGAPFNVTAHLTQLGASASLISAVGQDPLGEELLEVARNKGVETRFVQQARLGLATGTVPVTVDEDGNATYELVQPVAWDEITVTAEALAAAATGRAVIYGSLAGRSPYNLHQLNRLLNVPGPLKFFDVNLRPPFSELGMVVELARRADILKLNNSEVGRLAAWLRSGNQAAPSPGNIDGVAEGCAMLATATGVTRICVTRGDQGAMLWQRDEDVIAAAAPLVVVKDTVGAGDAFMAGLVVGLTRGMGARPVLESACRLGAYVASHNGATPSLPADIIQLFQASGPNAPSATMPAADGAATPG